MAKLNIEKGFVAASLIVKHLKGSLSEEEAAELEAWLNADAQHQQLFDELSSIRNIEEGIQKFKNTNIEMAWQRVYQKMSENWFTRLRQNRNIWWISAAATLMLTLAAWQVLYHGFNKPLINESLASKYGADLLPGTEKAELVLSDGTKVALGAHTDSIFADNGSSIHRTANGEIVYGKGETTRAEAWNTIYIPNGGQYMVTLEDGTRVWLNAASTLKYPLKFKGPERKVELIAGEAYFEVASNKEKPFIVVANRMDVQAVGTAFNVNSYTDSDSSTETTLVEGIIKVKALNKTNTLLPGNEIITNPAGSIIAKADLESVTAWKNGLFLFKGRPLPEVMKQLARWYDVEIKYDQFFTEKKFFTGEIKRNVPISKLLEMMELTGIARFRIMNHEIVVLPYTP